MRIGISPLVDFAFKLMLGSPEHSGVTIHFLNSILTDQPRIAHVEILQLNNLRVTADNVYHALPAERWSYFLQNADKLTPEDIKRLFPDEEIAEAAGVLEMISQTPEQLMLYNARLKFQRDEEARIIQASLEGEARGEARGRQEGRQEGFLAGRIVLLQELLGVRPSTAEELMRHDDTELYDMAEQLQHQLRSRR